jgi:hypothetical protein
MMKKKRNIKRFKEMLGLKFGKATVVSFSHINESTMGAHWVIKCECGVEKSVSGNSLRMGATKGCGCESKKQLLLGIKTLLGRKRPDIAGEKNPSWKGGVTPKHLAFRQSMEYKKWRRLVFERDGYTCVFCRKKGVVLNADHIKPFCAFESLRLDVDNGRTLCLECHRKTDTWGEGAKKYKNNSVLLAKEKI